MDLEEIGINARNRVDYAQDRNYWRSLVNAALNLRFPEAMELGSWSLKRGLLDKLQLYYSIKSDWSI